MKKKRCLPKILALHIGRMILAIMIIILILTVALQVVNSVRGVRKEAGRMFEQMDRVLSRSADEINQTINEYSDDCLRSANAIAYVLEDRLDIIASVKELKKLAALMGVDEIHIFNKEGEIIYGTHVEYYGYTFDSGEQISFFKPMLEDKTLSLVQEITPNTAEGKLVQYSAVWSEDEEFIVQIGMYPENLMRLMEKNELPYIFSLLLTNDRISLYAIDPGTEVILASTEQGADGKKCDSIGIDVEGVIPSGEMTGRLSDVDGRIVMVYLMSVRGNIIAYTYPVSMVADDILYPTLMFVLGVLIMSFILIRSVMHHLNKNVVESMNRVNSDLRSISEGNLDTVVSVETSLEFSELSSHINTMVRSLLSNTDKISYVLDRSKQRIGVYEYTENSTKVRYTEYIKEVFKLAETKKICDKEVFMRAIERFKKSPIPEASNIYEVRVSVNNEIEATYVSYEESEINGATVGILTDVTARVLERRKIEKELDYDMLTGLYNRRGLDNRIEQLRLNDKETGYCVLFMIDADGLKVTNDKYGHAVGDLYLKKIAETISNAGSKKKISARLGGDEFVHFMYGYSSPQEAKPDIEEIFKNQDIYDCEIADGLEITVSYSAGYCESKGCYDIEGISERADEYMYENKRSRKGENPR
ncbi:MAG: GGDEF domain-containing protein [Lachnospiraceae bacterium]|nr:GGDEF domain-containing protein [Lachnospiraceae bacterium]